MSKEDKEIKVTDKRMFTPQGELREEYRFLDEKSTAPEPAPPPETPAAAAQRGDSALRPEGREAPAAAPPSSRRGDPAARSDPRRAGGRSERDPSARFPPEPEPTARLEVPGTPPGLGPTFFDLAAMLAEPVAVYLGDLELPDGQSEENLEMARLHIDMLDVLRQKTAGNLTAQESAFLEDLLYRLRVRYVQKRG
ncbi:MAG TPA: DUF1844 domain-containing protein [Thermoanaerobaculia bacterium]|nr:DUF1844 domain-containing protein [Thermoanaerobaculia bacterium]